MRETSVILLLSASAFLLGVALADFKAHNVVCTIDKPCVLVLSQEQDKE